MPYDTKFKRLDDNNYDTLDAALNTENLDGRLCIYKKPMTEYKRPRRN
jgi:hypothetical protein